MSVLRSQSGSLGLFLASWLAFSTNLGQAGELPRFETVEIDPHVGEVCYAVTLADVDGDKRDDIVAVTENRVVWYRNPDWKPRVIVADATQRDNVCIAPHDIDGDGQVDFALGAGWLNNKNLGTICWLTRGPSLDQPWSVHAIAQESWTHRLRWGDLLGTGTPQLVVSPLNKTTGNGVRVLAFEIPQAPRTDRWKETIVDEQLNAMHNHWLGDLDGDGKADLITASLEGVYLFQRGSDGKLQKTKIGEGAPGPKEPQKSGAGEIKVGWLQKGRPFLATVEPMHGNQIAVYTPPAGSVGSALWTRHVLDATLGRGHAVGVGDLDGDGTEELVIGHSNKGSGDPAGPGVFYYKAADSNGTLWKKHVIDNGGIATEDLIVRDLNGDGRPDVVAGGRETHNVRLYLNSANSK
ncbi:MAG: VCBS repeat-containing protein [Planctomycetaceae bacterium]|nr:VCBS repeat-containing protein [Planctomycetaceae bacterium]